MFPVLRGKLCQL